MLMTKQSFIMEEETVTVTELAGMVKRRFDELESIFNDKLDTKIDGLELRIGRRIDGLESRFDGLEKRFDGLESRFDGLEIRFDDFDLRVGKKFIGLEKKMDAGFNDIKSRLDSMMPHNR